MTTAQPTTARPKYVPEPGDTPDDIIAHLQRDIEWLELVIREAREDLRDYNDHDAYIILKHSGVS